MRTWSGNSRLYGTPPIVDMGAYEAQVYVVYLPITLHQ
jgi:hypothetical protein